MVGPAVSTLAITGGTGFVGGALIEAAVAAGCQVRALARRPQATREGVEWVPGALDDAAALGRLVPGADAVVHVAGVVNAADRAGFVAGNVEGTRAVLSAATAAATRRFVHVSSLSAREPALSNYGWSKAEAERLVQASGLDWTIVRPPGVYGPGDMDQRDLFRAARFGVVPLPPRGALSIIHVDDLAALLLALAVTSGNATTYEPEQPGGPLSYAAYARAIGIAVGRRRIVSVPLPATLLRLVARGDRLLRGPQARLTADRVGYMVHPDWTADRAKRPPTALWHGRINAGEGLAATARWYRARGLL